MTARKFVVQDDVLTLARRRVSEVFDRFDYAVVSFSGGKDSTVVLNLALEEARARKADGRLPADYKLTVLFWDEEAIHPETAEYVQRVADLPEVNFLWYCLPFKHVNACSKEEGYWYPWAEEDREKWCRPLPATAITSVPGYPPEKIEDRREFDKSMALLFPADGRTIGMMLGIRADESMQRFRSVANRVVDNWVARDPAAGHIFKCKPIYDWTTLDVWTAPRAFGWDWNRAYDVMAKCGLSPSVQRVCHPFGQQPLTNLWVWQLCWPTLWDRLVERVPGAGTAARYCNSPLYAAGTGAVNKADDETWEQAIAREISKWEPEVQVKIAKRLQVEIRRHNRKLPGIRIPDTEPYIDLETGISSGLTYEFLLRVAIKGDFKWRMVPRMPNDGEIEKARIKAWGPDWRKDHPHAAANHRWKRRWNRTLKKWVYEDLGPIDDAMNEPDPVPDEVLEDDDAASPAE